MNPIKQYLKEMDEEFEKINSKFMSLIENMSYDGLYLLDTKLFKSFHSETIKGLLQMLVEEEKLKEGNNGDGLPFESSPELYGNARLESYKNGYNQSKQESRDRLLELIK